MPRVVKAEKRCPEILDGFTLLILLSWYHGPICLHQFPRLLVFNFILLHDYGPHSNYEFYSCSFLKFKSRNEEINVWVGVRGCVTKNIGAIF